MRHNVSAPTDRPEPWFDSSTVEFDSYRQSIDSSTVSTVRQYRQFDSSTVSTVFDSGLGDSMIPHCRTPFDSIDSYRHGYRQLSTVIDSIDSGHKYSQFDMHISIQLGACVLQQWSMGLCMAEPWLATSGDHTTTGDHWRPGDWRPLATALWRPLATVFGRDSMLPHWRPLETAGDRWRPLATWRPGDHMGLGQR